MKENIEVHMSDNDRDVLYTVSEVAKLLKTNTDYVHKLRRAGLLKFMKLGCFKVRKETLDNFLRDYEGFNMSDPFHITPLSS